VSVRPADIPGDPGGVVALGGSFANAADNVSALQGMLAGQLAGSWIGLSAGGYADKLGDFRPHLGGLEGSLRATGGHLNGWGDKLAAYQRTNHGYQQQFDDLASKQTTAASTAKTAKANHDAAANQPRSADPATHQHQESVLQGLRDTWHAAANALSDIETAIGDLVSLAGQLLQDFEHDAADVASAVRNEVHQLEQVIVAAGAAVVAMVGSDVAGLIREGESVVKRVASDVEHGAEEAGELLLHAGERAWKAEIQGLDYTYGAFVRPFLKDAGIFLAVVQIAVLVIPGVGEVAEPLIDVASAADSGLMLAGDSAMAAQHEKGYDGDVLKGDLWGVGLSIVPGGKDVKGLAKIVGKDAKPAEKLVQIGKRLNPITYPVERFSKDIDRIGDSQPIRRLLAGDSKPIKRLLAKTTHEKAWQGHAVDGQRLIDDPIAVKSLKMALDPANPPTPPAPTEPYILPMPLPLPPVLVVP
jgi:hypothetical protein